MLKLRRSIMLAAYFFLSAMAVSTAEEGVYSLKSAPDYKNIPVKVIQRIRMPAWYHEGIYHDGENIWLSNGKRGNIWIIDPSSGRIFREIKPSGGFTESITKAGGGDYIVSDWEDKALYLARIEGDTMVKGSEVSLAPAHPAGALWTKEKLFVITWTRGLGTKFDLLEMDKDMKLVRKVRITRIQEPAHMAWDGKNLWITSWYSKLVYKVDIGNLLVLGSFASPVSLTTGIAWDGKYMWLTGTYGDLYKLEVG